MKRLYAKWMHGWETRLTTQDTNRIVRPLEWGLDWTKNWPGVNGHRPAETAPAAEQYLLEWNKRIVDDSDRFFAYDTPKDFALETEMVRAAGPESPKPGQKKKTKFEQASFLRFTSPVRTPYPENDRVQARWFEAKETAPGRAPREKSAVIILPQWNAQPGSHNVLGKVLSRLGISALRMSKPYHDVRKPAETERADYAVSANLARTIDSCRQAVADIRSCLDWLESQGYRRFGILGTSLGSCYAFIASAHDPRLQVNAFNHASTYFADVVWTGQSTRHIRAGIQEAIDVDRLRRLWMAISPMAYMKKFADGAKKTLMVYAKYDLTFLPVFSRQVAEEFVRHQVDFQVKVLPCGHYTTGETPYKYIDAWWLCSFLYSAMRQT